MGREQLRARRPFYGWEGRAAWTQPPRKAVGTPLVQHPGKPRPRAGGVAQVSPLLGKEAGLGRGPFPLEAGISQAWEPGPPGRRLSRPLRPAWRTSSWLPWARCLPDSPRQSRPALLALPARGGGARRGSRWAGDRVTGLNGPSAWLGTGRSWLVCKNPDFSWHLGKRVKIQIWNSDSK